MKISKVTIQVLGKIITGGDNSDSFCYRSGRKLVDFFNQFDPTGIYSQEFPSRFEYTLNKLNIYNGTETMREIIKDALHPSYFNDETPNNEVAFNLNKHLIKDGFQLISENVTCYFSDFGPPTNGDFYIFDIQLIDNKTIDTSGIIKLNHEFITEQVRKAKDKLAKGDFDGAITNS